MMAATTEKVEVLQLNDETVTLVRVLAQSDHAIRLVDVSEAPVGRETMDIVFGDRPIFRCGMDEVPACLDAITSRHLAEDWNRR
jgi:hypothetical protein